MGRWHVGWLRAAGVTAMAGGVLMLLTQALLPHPEDIDGRLLRHLADNRLYSWACVLSGVAVLALAVAVTALAHLTTGRLGTLARRALPVGVTVALVQAWATGPALRFAAQDFRSAGATDLQGSFWAARGLAHLDDGLADAWAVVLLGLVPALVATALWRGGWSWHQAVLAWLGAVLAAGSAVADLLDLGPVPAVELLGVVCTSLWLAVAGILLVRLARARVARFGG